MKGAFNFRISEIKKVLDPVKMAKEAHKVFYANTAIRTGNARRNTNLYQNVIEANYPYAQRLDQGYSPQRPNGMTKPTMAFLKDYVKKNLGK
jgi:hypothetical protein